MRKRYPLDEASKAALNALGVHPGLQEAFTSGEPLTRNDYETMRILVRVSFPVPDIMSYDEYVKNYYYGESGGLPEPREEYEKQHSMFVPPYEEYLRLHYKYHDARRKGLANQRLDN